ncbi:SAG family member [Eimeria brunetti]|uniref:SAG family member n=1 Tax=Eimeria brunetti TaxID=51314 RepID=U6LQ42_9EIME|nr:SAG family member [Eimeria brunetti]
MAALKFLSLATAAIFVLDTSGVRAMEGAGATNSGVPVDCSKAMNAARDLVGFAGLTVEQTIPIKSDPTTSVAVEETYVESVCQALKAYHILCVRCLLHNEQDGVPVPAAKSANVDGTYAYAVQDEASADCEAAVEHWKAAFSNFSGLPPTYTESTDLYKNNQNISFISLFNPKESPKVDCAYFICPAKKTPPDTSDPADEGEEDVDGDGDGGTPPKTELGGKASQNLEGRNAASTDKEVKALLCFTTPKALNAGSAPYTQTQWDQIVTGLNKNAATGVPTFLGFAAAAVGALLL